MTDPIHNHQSDERTYTLVRGQAPLLVSVPHSGVDIPQDVLLQLTESAQGSVDTDWFMRELYLPITTELSASLISPVYSRYVIDLNRPESGESLYPGQTTTGLFPSERFDGESLYREKGEPSEAERCRRLETYWRPYHQTLQAELERLVATYGVALLWEGHSIRSAVPRLFEGRLPDLNLGTNMGASCDPSIEQSLRQRLSSVNKYSSVVNGRFRGGYITRHYGQPQRRIHAVQLELSQATYLRDETEPVWDASYTQDISAVISSLMSASLDAALGLATNGG